MKIDRFVRTLSGARGTWTRVGWQHKLVCPSGKCSETRRNTVTLVLRAQNSTLATSGLLFVHFPRVIKLITRVFSSAWQMAGCSHVESIFLFNVYRFRWHVTQNCACNSLEKQFNFCLSHPRPIMQFTFQVFCAVSVYCVQSARSVLSALSISSLQYSVCLHRTPSSNDKWLYREKKGK